MSTNGAVEADVFLGVDGRQIDAAFANINKHLSQMQGQINGMGDKLKSTLNGLDAQMLKSLSNLNKAISTLDAAQKNVQRFNPAVQSGQSWAKYQADQKQARADERKHMREVDAAYQQRERQVANAADRRARQEAQMWAQRDRAAQTAEAKEEQLAERRWAVARARETRLEREREQSMQRTSRLAEQNNFKIARDKVQQEVKAASGLRELDNQRLVAADRLNRARAMLGKFGAEEDRQLLQMIQLEKERLALAEARIKADRAAASSRFKSDAAVDGRLNVRTGKTDEAQLASALGLGQARARQAQLETQIANQIQRARTLTGEEKVDAERVLKVDEARLQVIKSRVRELEREAKAMVQSAQPKPGMYGPPTPPGFKPPGAPPAPPSGGGLGGLFGSGGIGGIFLRTAAYGGAAAAIYGTIAAIKDGITASIQFRDEIAKIGAVAGLTASQQDKLASSIQSVASNSRFATDEIAQATMVMAQAGFSASDITDSLQNVANLAAASGTSFQEATDVVTGAIGAFQLQTSETAHIADTLTSALNTTKLNIQQVALGIQYAGATAYESKVSFEELTAVMATMAQAGIRSGSTIGTGVRQFLVDLQTPTKKMTAEMTRLGLTMEDLNVKTLGLPEVLRRLGEAGFGSASAYGSLETRAAAAYLVLKNNQGLLQEQITLQNSLGASAEAAAKGSESLAAEWQRFKNQLNESVDRQIKPATDALRDMLHMFNEMGANEDLRRMRENLRNLEEGSDAWIAQIDAIEAYKEALRGSVEIEEAHAEALDAANTRVNEAKDALDAQETTIQSSSDAISRLVQRQVSLKGNSAALAAETATLESRFEGLASQLYGTAASYENLILAMQRYRKEAIATGALKSAELSMAYDQKARAQGDKAGAYANRLIANGTYQSLPKDVQNAIVRLANNPRGPEANTLGMLISDYANKRGTGLNKIQQGDLRAYALNATGAGLSAVYRDQARNQSYIYNHLGSKKGQELLAGVDNMAKMSEADKKKFFDGLLAGAGNMNKSESVRGAYQLLANMAQGQLGADQAAPSGGSKKSGSAASRAEREQDRRNQKIADMRLKATEAELKNALKGITDKGGDVSGDGGEITVSAGRGLTKTQLLKNMDRVDKALDKWIEDRTKQVKAQIDSANMSPEEGQLMMDELAREIAEKRESTAREMEKGLVDAMDAMVETIMNVKERAEQAADQVVALADARLRALDRSALKGQVPDYVRAGYERMADRAKENRDAQQIGINNKTIESLQAKQTFWQDIFDEAKARGAIVNLQAADDKLAQIKDQMTQLQMQNEVLQTSLQTSGLVPQSIGESWKAVVDNWRDANKGAGDLSNVIRMNLGDALNTVQGSMEEFLGNVISGTMSMREAFRSMVQSIIQYLIKLIVKMLVVKALQAALGGGGGGTGEGNGIGSFGSSSPSFSGYVGIGSSLGHFNGGEIGRSNGGMVENGVPSRDSVRTKLAKGEFVQRKWAVDNVGRDFMADLNNRGKAALTGVTPKIVMPPPAHQEMKVYVVSEESKPQMGPNDVLVTVANDIIKGGNLKQLVKHVSQGG
ncbi:phage tail tape measure protein [Sphingomonas jaspsi]|uniref:phage tail tape measure protein n=1 Tax=Sphingomonas jaspsi TaxID=392409 RepID=UPI0004B930DF|nr:phage tail tape measure protein [Sphingomonas jaspsi]